MLELVNVTKSYRSGLFARGEREVLHDVTFRLARGQTVGLVGQSGSGKTTLARVALRLTRVSSGSVLIDGVDITSMSKGKLRPMRNHVQIVFQHPETALDPEFRLRESLQEALLRAGVPRSRLRERMAESCAQVSIPPDLLDRYPSQVSGGEIQRAAIARVLAFNPDYLFLDEPTSMLDISVQAHILGLIRDTASTTGTGIVLISHDLDVVRAMCHEVAVLHAGRLVESGRQEDVLAHPTSDGAKALVSAWAAQEAELSTEPGEVGPRPPQCRADLCGLRGDDGSLDFVTDVPSQYQRNRLS